LIEFLMRDKEVKDKFIAFEVNKVAEVSSKVVVEVMIQTHNGSSITESM